MPDNPIDFQTMIQRLNVFWASAGCVIQQPYNSEVGAGTFNPATFLRALGPEPWRVAYVEPCRRPKDGRYAKNPNRFQQFHQYQVLLKPSPRDVMDLYLESLQAIDIELDRHDIRFVEDDWESPTLGAAGLGWEVWLDGMEITQFTYFQQVGGLEVEVVSAELSYGLERLAMYIQQVDNTLEIEWGTGVTWGDVYEQFEVEFCRHNFEEADTKSLFAIFEIFESEAKKLLDWDLVFPGYDCVLKCSHAFNMLDARGAISVTERTGYIARVRRLARKAALCYLKQRELMGHPLLEKASMSVKARSRGNSPGSRERWKDS